MLSFRLKKQTRKNVAEATEITFNVFKVIRRLTMALKNYIHSLRNYTSFSWLKYQLKVKYNTTQKRISHPVAFVVDQLTLRKDIYCIAILHSPGGKCRQIQKNKSTVSCTYRQNKHNFTFCIILILLLLIIQIKAPRLNHLEK